MHFGPEDDAGVSSQHSNTQSPAPGVAAEAEPMIRVVEKATCFSVHRGNEVVGNFAGPDCAEHAQMFADVLQANAAAVPVAWLTEHDSGDMLWNDKTEAEAYSDDNGPIPLYTAPPLPAQVQAMTRGEIDALVYRCRQDGDDTTYAIVNAALATRTPAPGMAPEPKTFVKRVGDGFIRQPDGTYAKPAPGMAGGVGAINDLDCGTLRLVLSKCGPAGPGSLPVADMERVDALLQKLTSLAAPHPAPAQQAAGAEPRKRWPFVETPGEFTERLRIAIRQFGDLLPAVRNVLIENPAQIKQGADGPLSELTRERSSGVEEAILTHEWRDSASYGGEVCASCGAVKGSAKSWRTCGFTSAPAAGRAGS